MEQKDGRNKSSAMKDELHNLIVLYNKRYIDKDELTSSIFYIIMREFVLGFGLGFVAGAATALIIFLIFN